MQKLDPKTDGQSMDIVAENIEKLKTLFPEAFKEGGIDFEALKEILGDYTDDREERYSFTWNGKSKARQLAQTPSTGTLRPCPEESINWDTTQNLFIEGDNLEVLKLLQKSYYKKVKMIYIDPPYNTGKDFIYPDDFRDNIKNYLELTGQVDSEGRKLSANAEISGRYHTDWLNMMYPRLRLARNLLRDDGVIFVSIDDNEVANLRKVCDEIFGEENFIAQFIWKKRSGGGYSNTLINNCHEYLIVYSKEIEFARLNDKQKSGEGFEKKYPLSDEKSIYKRRDLRKSGSADLREDRPSMYYEVIAPDGTKILPKRPDGRDGRWSYGKERFEELLKEGEVEFVKTNEYWKVYTKERPYSSDGKLKAEKYESIFADVALNTHGTNEIKNLFPESQSIFDFPKPSNLIKHALSIGSSKGDLILDFFSGSATTVHAVLNLNKEDNGNRKFIMVQLPEPCDEKSEAFKAGYETIVEIGKERVRRVIKKINEEDPEYKGDLGFKVFKLDSTNIKPWDVDFDNFERTLEDYISNIKDGRSEEDVLYEILLKYGLDLTLPIEERSIAGKKVFSIGYGALVICLADDITLETVEGIADLKKELQPELMRVVFKDMGFRDDVVKTNAMQILRQAEIKDVKSL